MWVRIVQAQQNLHNFYFWQKISLAYKNSKQLSQWTRCKHNLRFKIKNYKIWIHDKVSSLSVSWKIQKTIWVQAWENSLWQVTMLLTALTPHSKAALIAGIQRFLVWGGLFHVVSTSGLCQTPVNWQLSFDYSLSFCDWRVHGDDTVSFRKFANDTLGKIQVHLHSCTFAACVLTVVSGWFVFLSVIWFSSSILVLRELSRSWDPGERQEQEQTGAHLWNYYCIYCVIHLICFVSSVPFFLYIELLLTRQWINEPL